MDFKEIKSKKLEREYECTLSNADVAQAVNSKLEIARENFQMKGFRKGHTPLKPRRTTDLRASFQMVAYTDPRSIPET